MPHTSTAPLNFYATHSRMTDPRSYTPLLAELPPDIPALCTVAQGLVIHFGMGDRYGVELAARRQEARLRAVAPMLARIGLMLRVRHEVAPSECGTRNIRPTGG